MNKYIKRELSKVTEVNIVYSDDDAIIHIPKKEKIRLLVDNYYLIKLSDTMLFPSEGSILVTNWNNNCIPKYRYYKVDVLQTMSNMVKVNGVAYDADNETAINSTWSGWIPINELEVLKTL